MPRKFDSYRLSKRAEADLAQIYAYTASHWSVEQANRYIGDIRSTIAGLVEGAKAGRRRADLSEDYLFCMVGSHLTVYRETNLILVVRVLHQAMDAPRYLKP